MSLKKIVSANSDLNRIQDAIRQAYDFLTADPFAKRQTIDVAVTVAGTVEVPHALGRVPTGWVVVDRNSAATVYRSAWSATSISLVFSGAQSARVIVF